jgi:hypothetical protein
MACGLFFVDSFDGDLTAKVNLGNVSVYANRHKLIKIDVEQGLFDVAPSL